MTCKCGSTRIMNFQAKCSDMSVTSIPHLDVEADGYVPRDIGIGGGDYIRMDVCLECGMIQGWTPITDEEIQEMDEFK